MKLNDKVYDILKWVSLVALDAVGVAYKGLAECWGWGFGTEVMTTCAILSALIGTLIGVSSVSYHKQEAKDADEALDAILAGQNEPLDDEAVEIFPEEEAPIQDDTGNIDGGEI